MKNFETLNPFSKMLCDRFEEDVNAVDNVSRPTKDIMEEIKKEEEDRIREEKKNAAKNQLAEDNCRQQYEAILVRYNRAKERAMTDKLKSRTTENDAYKAGNLDTEEHRENLSKIEDTYDEAIRKAEKEKQKALENLRTANPKAYNRVVGW